MDTMSRKPAHYGFSGFLQRALRLPSSRRAGIAVTIALSAPMLIAATGLSVDVGYWYQEQESLQSAADAAALAAANAQVNFGTTSSQNLPETVALAAANAATDNQFNLTSTTLTVTSPSPSSTSATEWVATATAPRGSFFSRVKGMGL